MPVMRTFLLALEATFLVLILASKPAADEVVSRHLP